MIISPRVKFSFQGRQKKSSQGKISGSPIISGFLIILQKSTGSVSGFPGKDGGVGVGR